MKSDWILSCFVGVLIFSANAATAADIPDGNRQILEAINKLDQDVQALNRPTWEVIFFDVSDDFVTLANNNHNPNLTQTFCSNLGGEFFRLAAKNSIQAWTTIPGNGATTGMPTNKIGCRFNVHG